jgi:hypothetical protein
MPLAYSWPPFYLPKAESVESSILDQYVNSLVGLEQLVNSC